MFCSKTSLPNTIGVRQGGSLSSRHSFNCGSQLKPTTSVFQQVIEQRAEADKSCTSGCIGNWFPLRGGIP